MYIWSRNHPSEPISCLFKYQCLGVSSAATISLTDLGTGELWVSFLPFLSGGHAFSLSLSLATAKAAFWTSTYSQNSPQPVFSLHMVVSLPRIKGLLPQLPQDTRHALEQNICKSTAEQATWVTSMPRIPHSMCDFGQASGNSPMLMETWQMHF